MDLTRLTPQPQALECADLSPSNERGRLTSSPSRFRLRFALTRPGTRLCQADESAKRAKRSGLGRIALQIFAVRARTFMIVVRIDTG